MGWINTYQHFQNYKDNNYNSCVFTSKYNLQYIVDSFDSIFGNFTDFSDTIASVKIYPFSLEPQIYEQYPIEEYDYFLKTIKLGTNINAYRINDNSTYINLGQCKIDRFYNNFADFKGYTHIKLYIPFVGFVDVDVNECMGKWLQFRMYVDFVSGNAIFIVGVTNRELPLNNITYMTDKIDIDREMRVISTYVAEIGIDIPLGSSNYGDFKRNILLGAVKTAVGLSTGIYLGNTPQTSTAKTVKTYDIQGRSKAKGSRMKQLQSGTETTERTVTYNNEGGIYRSVSQSIQSGLDVINNNDIPSYTDRVSSTDLSTCLSKNIQVIIYRPKFVEQGTDFNSLYGKPLGEVRTLKDISGYTEISNIHIEGLNNATNFEIDMLEQILANGIFLGEEFLNFEIGGKRYRFKGGMTFDQWVNSELNTDEFEVNDNVVFSEKLNYVVANPDASVVKPDDLIRDIIYNVYRYRTNFDIDNVEYTMTYPNYTWNDFVVLNSDYFTILGDNYVVRLDGNIVVNGEDYYPENVVTKNMTVENNGIYSTTSFIKTQHFSNTYPGWSTPFSVQFLAFQNWEQFINSTYNTDNKFTLNDDNNVLFKGVLISKSGEYDLSQLVSYNDYVYQSTNYGTKVEDPLN